MGGYLKIVACPGAKVTVDVKKEGPTMDFKPEGKFDEDKNQFDYPADLEEKYRIRGYTTKFSERKRSENCASTLSTSPERTRSNAKKLLRYTPDVMKTATIMQSADR